jgi:dienelactone hydrolase
MYNSPFCYPVTRLSRGGTAAIYSTVQRFQKMWGPEFKAVVTYPFYPSCFDKVQDDDNIVGAIREFHGGADDYASIEQCRAYISRLKAAGKDVESTEYQGAQHTFDNISGNAVPTVGKGSQSQKNCHVVETNGVLINQETKAEFTYKDDCVTVDPHSGFDHTSAVASFAAVLSDIRSRFSLN